MVIEKALYYDRGGLLHSEVTDNFVFDVGGSHVIFSRNREVLENMLSLLSGNVVAHERCSFVSLDGMFVPYPFENGIYVLPPEIRAEAFIDFMEAWMSRQSNWRPHNLKEWIYGFFGKWIAKKYLVPYNEKIWKRPLDQIDVEWVFTPGRLPIPDWREIARAAASVPTVGYVEQSRFYYPLRGGIQALYDATLIRAKERGKVHLGRGCKGGQEG